MAEREKYTGRKITIVYLDGQVDELDTANLIDYNGKKDFNDFRYVDYWPQHISIAMQMGLPLLFARQPRHEGIGERLIPSLPVGLIKLVNTRAIRNITIDFK